jgi:hypothetical protein
MSYLVGVAIQKALAGLVAGRVYPIRIDDAPVYPCIRYTSVNRNYINTLCGQSNLSESRYRVDIFATTIKEAEQLAASALSIMRGASFEFKNTPLSSNDGYEPSIGVYRKSLDFQIWEAEQMT